MNRKLLFLALLSQLFVLTLLAQQPTCKTLRTGSFKMVSAELGTTYITRTGKTQVEKNEKLGYEVIFDIKWIDDCTYELRPKKLVKGNPAIMGDGTYVVKTKITGITYKNYTAETSSNFSEEEMKFMIEIVNDNEKETR